MKTLHHWLSSPLLWTIGIMLALTLLSVMAIMIAYRVLQPQLKKTAFNWDSALLKSAYVPLIGYCLLAATWNILDRLSGFVSPQTIQSLHLEKANVLSFFAMLLWQLMRFLRYYEQATLTDSKAHFKISTVRAVSQLIRITLIMLAILILLQIIGIPISALLTFGGIGGIAIGFAAKDSLANFLGGLMLYIDQPFAVGDWIRSDDKPIEGTVEHIGWRLTRIRTFDRRPLYVPNGIFSSISIENPSRMTNRRIKTIVGLRYQDAEKIPAIIADIKQMLIDHPEIDSKQTMLINLVGFGDSALNILIYTFTKTTVWVPFQNIQEDVFLKILDIVRRHKAECAFPTRMLHVSNEEWPTANKPA